MVKAARAQVADEMQHTDQDIAHGYRNAPAHAKKGFDGAAAAAKAADKEIVRSAEKATKEQEKARENLFQIRSRYLAQEQAAEESAGKRSTARASRIASQSVQNFTGIVRAGMRTFSNVAGGLVRGLGVNLDVGTNVAAGVKAQSSATLLANKGFIEGGEGDAGKRQDPAVLMKEAGVAADATAHSTNQMLEAMTSFVERSGDLTTARKMISEIGKVSNATGADMGKLGEVAGALDLKLQGTMGDANQRMAVISNVVRSFAGQGKEGAIDIEQLVPQISKLIAASGNITGGKEQAFQTAGILAQISAKAGGSGTASQAATSVVAFTRDMMKTKGEALIEAKGVKVFEDNKKTKIRDPIAIAMESVAKAQGNMAALTATFKGSAMFRAVQGFAATYNDAGGGKAGEAAMAKEVAGLRAGNMSKDEVERENARVMATTAAKAQVFQNNLERAAASMAEHVLPALEKLAPKFLQAADYLERLIGWASENPWPALGIVIGASITGSIAKAAIGEVVASQLKALISGAGGGGAPGGGPLGVAAGVGLLVAGAAAGYKLSQKDPLTGAEKGAVAGGLGGAALMGPGGVAIAALAYAHGKATQLGESIGGGLRVQEPAAKGLKGRLAAAMSELNPAAGGAAPGSAGAAYHATTGGTAAAAHADAAAAATRAQTAALLGATLNVRVTNQPAAIPGVDGAARTPPHP